MQCTFTPAISIDTTAVLTVDSPHPLSLIVQGDEKLKDAMYYRDPTRKFLIRKRRGLAVVRLNDLFVELHSRAHVPLPCTWEIYDRAILQGLIRPPSYTGIFICRQAPLWMRENKIKTCLIGSQPFLGSDGHKYIPELSDFMLIDGHDYLQLKARRASNDTQWSIDEPWLFEV